MRKYLLIVYFLFFFSFAFSQSLDLRDYAIHTYHTSFVKTNKSPAFWNEAPPLVIKGKFYQYIFTTHFSTMWSSTLSIGKPKDDILHVGSWQGNIPQWITASSHWWGQFYKPDYLQSAAYEYKSQWSNYHWRRNYNGIFAAHVVEHKPSDQQIFFALSHGENKNEKIGDNFYQNTVRTDFVIDKDDQSTYSGGIPYQDCWEAYFGFLNGNWSPYNEKNGWGNVYLNDIGPVAWPSAGYLREDGSQASTGLRHPSSIIEGEYLYIFVVDESRNGNSGVKLIRSHISNLLLPANYETWSKSGWISSLPEGFTKERAAEFFRREGPDNTPVFEADRNTIRFSVARLKDSNEFIGVEEYIMGGGDHTIKAAFRFSKDLIHWSERVPIYSASDWSSSSLKYPIFLNSEGTSNSEIEVEEFYILGSAGDGTVTKMHFKLDNHIFPAEGSSPNSIAPNAFINSSGRMSGDADFTVSPVPASLTIDIKFTVGSASHVQVNLYDARGVKVRNLLENDFQPQVVAKTFDVSQLQRGLYVLELVQNGKRSVKKIVKL